MALIEISAPSDVLQTTVSFNVILPENGAAPCRTLYLLHGMSDDHTAWLRRSSIERYVEDTSRAVVTPFAALSFYTDEYCGDDYFQFVSRELPALCRQLFPQMSHDRNDTFVAGLSMGGYGAIKCALLAPETFSCAASLSGALDMASRVEHASPDDSAYFFDLFGPADAMRGSPNDLFAAAANYAAAPSFPIRLYMACGTEDFLYQDNLRFRDHLRRLHLDPVWQEAPGAHTWDFWDAEIQNVIRWLLPQKEE